jgi:hypothetical protein
LTRTSHSEYPACTARDTFSIFYKHVTSDDAFAETFTRLLFERYVKQAQEENEQEA